MLFIKNKKAEIKLLVSILLILILITAFIIAINMFFSLTKESSRKICLDPFTNTFEIREVEIGPKGDIKINVFRKTGEMEITKFKFIFYDKSGNSAYVDITNDFLTVFESKEYEFISGDIGMEVSKIFFIPFFIDCHGLEVEGRNYIYILGLKRSLPEEGETDVDKDLDEIEIYFSFPVTPGGSGGGGSGEGGGEDIKFSYGCDDVSASVIPSEDIQIIGDKVIVIIPPLEYSTEYCVILEEGAFEDYEGQLSEGDCFCFTTENPPPLTLDSYIPTGNDLSIPYKLDLGFSEDVEGVAGKYIRIIGGASDILIEATDIANVIINGADVEIILSGINYGTSYYINIDLGAFRGTAYGTEYEGLSDQSWGFQTLTLGQYGDGPYWAIEDPGDANPKKIVQFYRNQARGSTSVYPVNDGYLINLLNLQTTPDGTVYASLAHEVGTIDNTGDYTTIASIGWAAGLAYDSTRDRIIFISIGGGGNFYVCNPTECTHLSVIGRNCADIAYLALNDVLYCAPNKRLDYDPPDDVIEWLEMFNPVDGSYIGRLDLSAPMIGGYTSRTGIQLHSINGNELIYLQGAVPVYRINPTNGQVTTIIE